MQNWAAKNFDKTKYGKKLAKLKDSHKGELCFIIGNGPSLSVNDLNKLYEKDILYPKYRNFVAVCTMLEYFETSRCSSLTGADGAYNLFESETRQNLVILKLDEILENLDELKTAMYKCCTVLEKASKQLDDVLQELQQINAIATQQLSFQALTMSYASAAAKNTEAIKYLTLIS